MYLARGIPPAIVLAHILNNRALPSTQIYLGNLTPQVPILHRPLGAVGLTGQHAYHGLPR